MYIKIIVALAVAMIGIGSYYFGPFKGVKDNPIEQEAEVIIKSEMGVDIDLTPAPEENNGK